MASTSGLIPCFLVLNNTTQTGFKDYKQRLFLTSNLEGPPLILIIVSFLFLY